MSKKEQGLARDKRAAYKGHNQRGKSAENPLETIRRLFNYIFRRNKLVFGLVCISIIFSSLGILAISLGLRYFLDQIILPHLGQLDWNFRELYQALIVMGLFFAFVVCCTWFYNRMMVTIGQRVLKDVRDDMFRHMQELPIAYFDQHSHGEVMSLYTNDTDALRQMINQSIPQGLSSAVSIISAFISMLVISPVLTLTTLLVIALMFVVLKRVGGSSAQHFMAQQRRLAELTGFVEERMHGQRVVKVFNHEQISMEEFDQLNAALYERASKAHSYASSMGPLIGNIGNLFFVFVAVVGGVLSVTGIGGLTIGTIAAFLQLSKTFTQPFMGMAQQFNSIAMALAGAERIFALIDAPQERDEGQIELVNVRRLSDGSLEECQERTGLWAWKRPAGQEPRYTELRGDVRIEDMSFSYDGKNTVLHDIQLYAKPGQKLAFVGSTGAGKTTITNLINRFYDVQKGRILYDGIDIQDIRKDDLRRSLAVVLQDTHLFTGSIADNIRYGKLDATDEEVVAAAKLAYADHFIRMLPEGYNTQISGEGEELSQGQRQLLSIARAAIANPPVLILDEATSSIDTRTERIVQRGMDNLMEGRTVFVIAHRLSTIRNSNAIMVLEHGHIIERGDHEELLAQKGTYYQLYTGNLELS